MIARHKAIRQRIADAGTGGPRDATSWEWRAFDPQIGLPEVPGLEITARYPLTTETWLLSPCSSFNVRICGQEMAISRLERIDRRNLELWRTIHRYQFPIDAAAIAAVCVNLGAPEPTIETPVGRDRFLAAMTFAAPDVMVAPVQTAGIRFRLADCDGEHLDIVVGDQRWESLAFFSHDPGRVHTALQRLGLSTYTNMNWPRALKLMLGVANRPAIR